MPENNENRQDSQDSLPSPARCPPYTLTPQQGAPGMPQYRVIPAGKAFYHVVEIATNRVLGYRRRHCDACALAERLETGR